MSRRTREQIEHEITILQAELAAVQPDEATFESVVCREPLRVRVLHGTPSVAITGDVANAFDAAPLRDWLNYHFPKETA